MLVEYGKQHTIENEVEIGGWGIHTGDITWLTLKPADPDRGIVFRRVDQEGQPEIVAHAGNIYSSDRATTLISPEGRRREKKWREKKREAGDAVNLTREENEELDGFLVKTVEHLVASFGAVGIDNIIVEIDSSELPSEEGSAMIYYVIIDDCGFKKQDKPRQYLVPERPMAVSRDNTYLLVLPPDDFQAPDPAGDVSYPEEKLESLSLELEYQLDYGEEPPGYQNYRFNLPLAVEPKVRFELFEKEIVAARTFALEREFDDLVRMGLAQSGLHKEPLLFDDEGANQILRYPEEPARHKLLDLLGDLYLAGPLAARVLAVRSGHQLNQEMAGLLADLRDDQDQ